MKQKIGAFIKAQASAFIGGAFDYGVMVFCKEVIGIDVKNAIRISGSLGAVVNFTLNRYWAFKKSDSPVGNQIWKFILVVLGSIFLKSEGTPLVSNLLHIDYKIGRLAVEVIVSLGFNYPLQRFWVFK
ncbi:GtrA family protein [Sphingobacterium spiritivorum]|uniref:GtrA family protein n=1 Tax=Sphingobacterium spiritivorum TaxID=258 RepID=UPI003DA36CA5